MSMQAQRQLQQLQQNEEYNREWRANVMTRLDDLAEGQGRTNVAMQEIKGKLENVMPTKDIQVLVETRVSRESFDGEKALIWAAIKRLENSPAQLRGWLGLMIAAGGCVVAPVLGATSAGVVTLIIWLITSKP